MAKRKAEGEQPTVVSEEWIMSVAAAAWDGGRALRLSEGGYMGDKQDMQPWEFAPKPAAREHVEMVRAVKADATPDSPEEAIAQSLMFNYG